jgi:hypothetical protein
MGYEIKFTLKLYKESYFIIQSIVILNLKNWASNLNFVN